MALVALFEESSYKKDIVKAVIDSINDADVVKQFIEDKDVCNTISDVLTAFFLDKKTKKIETYDTNLKGFFPPGVAEQLWKFVNPGEISISEEEDEKKLFQIAEEGAIDRGKTVDCRRGSAPRYSVILGRGKKKCAVVTCKKERNLEMAGYCTEHGQELRQTTVQSAQTKSLLVPRPRPSLSLMMSSSPPHSPASDSPNSSPSPSPEKGERLLRPRPSLKQLRLSNSLPLLPNLPIQVNDNSP